MVKERALRTGASVFAAFLLALPAMRASFAEDVQPPGHDHAPQGEADRPGDSTPVLSHESTGGGTTPDEHTPQKAADTPAKTDGTPPPKANPAVTPQDARSGSRGGGSQSGSVEKAGSGSGAKNSPALNAPTKDLGPADTHMVVPLQRSTGTPDNAHPGNKTFKIVTPEQSRPVRPPAAGGAHSTVRNAIGQTVTSHEVIPGHAGEPFSRSTLQSPGGGAGSTGNAFDGNRNGGATRVVVPNSTPSVTAYGQRGAVGAGPNRPGSVPSGIGGPAKKVSGINGTTLPPQR